MKTKERSLSHKAIWEEGYRKGRKDFTMELKEKLIYIDEDFRDWIFETMDKLEKKKMKTEELKEEIENVKKMIEEFDFYAPTQLRADMKKQELKQKLEKNEN